MKQVYGAFVAPLEREGEPLEKLTELQKGVMSCADWHLQTQILKVDEKSDPDMTKSRGYNEDEARAAPKCWMDVEKFDPRGSKLCVKSDDSCRQNYYYNDG